MVGPSQHRGDAQQRRPRRVLSLADLKLDSRLRRSSMRSKRVFKSCLIATIRVRSERHKDRRVIHSSCSLDMERVRIISSPAKPTPQGNSQLGKGAPISQRCSVAKSHDHTLLTNGFNAVLTSCSLNRSQRKMPGVMVIERSKGRIRSKQRLQDARAPRRLRLAQLLALAYQRLRPTEGRIAKQLTKSVLEPDLESALRAIAENLERSDGSVSPQHDRWRKTIST